MKCANINGKASCRVQIQWHFWAAGSCRSGCLKLPVLRGPQHPPVLMPPPCCELVQTEKVTARPTAGGTYKRV